MKIILHIGLHKTGTTYVQTLLQQIVEPLRQRGIFFPAGTHHDIAAAVLRGDFRLLHKAIDEAKVARCETIVVSAEDLENLLFDIPAAQAMQAELIGHGLNQIDWLASIRSQDDYFWSLYAEMSRHAYLEPFSMFHQVMTRGYLHVPAADPRSPIAHWNFCFDYAKFLPAFAASIKGHLHLDEFTENSPFPLSRLFTALGISDLLGPAHTHAVKNVRRPEPEIGPAYEAVFLSALSETQRGAYVGLIANRATVDSRLQTSIGEQIADRFKKSNVGLLKKYPFAIGRC